jgi:uncharacterized membrane protein
MIKNIILLVFLLICIDSIWLFMIKDKYSDMIQSITYEKMNINIYYAIITYVLLAIGLYCLVILDNNNVNNMLLKSFLFGFVTYGVYDATNASIFDKWHIGLAVCDTLWGSLLCTSATYIYIKMMLIK